MRRKAKIVATLGPAVDSADRLRALIEAGINVVRFNFSHGADDSHRKRFAWVRAVADDLDLPIATLQDIQGPKSRVGTFPDSQIELEDDATVTLVPGEGEGDAGLLHVAYLDAVQLDGLVPGVFS